MAGDQSVDLDELYSYDELSQLIATERGRLVFDDPNPGDVSLVDEVFGQEWSLDGLGNWVAFDDDGDAQTPRDERRERDHRYHRRVRHALRTMRPAI